jgi:hypothetical protein
VPEVGRLGVQERDHGEGYSDVQYEARTVKWYVCMYICVG